jgi:hypothetical protein
MFPDTKTQLGAFIIMNKKDLSAFRRQFKTGSIGLDLKELYTAYVKKDNQSILHAELASFDGKGEAEQEIYLGGFKKLLTGGLNAKIFELFFDTGGADNEGQALCRQLLAAGQKEFAARCNDFITRLAAHYVYETDIAVSFVKGKYSKPAGKKSRAGAEESLDGFDDTSYGFEFVLCSVSKADDTKRGLFYDAATERFELKSSLNKEIHFPGPLEGFMYPAIGDFGSDVNKILYYTSKANVRNEDLLENVLFCRCELTAGEEKERFEELLRRVSGDRIKPEILKNVYDAVRERLEGGEDGDEPVALGASELRDIFEESGLRELGGFEDAYEQTAEKGYVFKAASLVGDGGAPSLRLSSGVADIHLNLEDLRCVRQVINARGRKCLEIELGDDAAINGIPLETEGT